LSMMRCPYSVVAMQIHNFPAASYAIGECPVVCHFASCLRASRYADNTAHRAGKGGGKAKTPSMGRREENMSRQGRPSAAKGVFQRRIEASCRKPHSCLVRPSNIPWRRGHSISASPPRGSPGGQWPIESTARAVSTPAFCAFKEGNNRPCRSRHLPAEFRPCFPGREMVARPMSGCTPYLGL